jgi:hypothetical protein
LLGDADQLYGGRVGRVPLALAAGRSACRGGRFATERFRAKPLVVPRRPPEAAAAPLAAFLERGYFWLISALTCEAFVVSGTLSLPSWIRVCAAWISFQTLAEM